MRIVVAGATGLIGRALSGELVADGHEVVALTRRPEKAADILPGGVRPVRWSGDAVEEEWARELEGAHGVVSVTGADIGSKRWTERRKREIRSSRVDPTSALVAAIERLAEERRPAVLVNASGVDYYGDRGDEVVTEETGPSESFLGRVGAAWEAAALRAEELGIRVVTIRTAVAIARDALAFRLMVLPFRLFAGGPLGSGRQWFPLVHLRDVVGLYRFALERDALRGPVNVVAPDVRRQRDVAREIGRILRRPSFLPAPAPALRIVLGERADLLLHSKRAEPRKALAAGYEFHYPELPAALEEALR